jgi:hypothetical protein
MGEAVEMGRGLGEPQWEASRLRQEEIMFYWTWIDHELDRVQHIWCGHWTKDALRELAMNENFQVWGFGPRDQIRVIVFTQLVSYPIGNILQIFLAFGNSLEEAIPIMEATFERFAMETECRACEIHGRFGWERKLKGFKREYVVLTRILRPQGVH